MQLYLTFLGHLKVFYFKADRHSYNFIIIIYHTLKFIYVVRWVQEIEFNEDCTKNIEEFEIPKLSIFGKLHFKFARKL